MTKVNELAPMLTAVSEQVAKIGGETRQLLVRIQELTDVINAGGDVPPEVMQALENLEAQVAIVDELVADPAPPEDPVDPVPLV